MSYNTTTVEHWRPRTICRTNLKYPLGKIDCQNTNLRHGYLLGLMEHQNDINIIRRLPEG
ncbi:hypothetical protein MMA231_02169 [Asticcacaulis sp. MM231]